MALVVFLAFSTDLVLPRVSLPDAVLTPSCVGQGVDQANDFLNEVAAASSSASASWHTFLKACFSALSSGLAGLPSHLAPFFSMVSSRAAWLVFSSWWKPCSNGSTFLTSMSSMKPLFTANSVAFISEIGSGLYWVCL